MKRIALLMCVAGLCESANTDKLYEIFDFSFANVPVSPSFGTVPGTVTGTFAIPIACLVACTNQAAVYATVTDFPTGLESVVGGAPIVFLPYQPTLPDESEPNIGPNSFSVTAGNFTDAELSVSYEFQNGPHSDGIALELDDQGMANFLFLGGTAQIGGELHALDVFDLEGLDGLTITPVGSVLVAPEPTLWPILSLGLAGLVWLKRNA